MTNDPENSDAHYLDILVDYLSHTPRWMQDAQCAQLRGNRDAILQACQNCPVMRECKAYADEYGINTGVWGGEVRG